MVLMCLVSEQNLLCRTEVAVVSSEAHWVGKGANETIRRGTQGTVCVWHSNNGPVRTFKEDF